MLFCKAVVIHIVVSMRTNYIKLETSMEELNDITKVIRFKSDILEHFKANHRYVYAAKYDLK